MPDHLNNIERVLIENLRTGTYDGGTAWSSSDVKVFGQFPETEDVEYPCIVVEMVANGIEEQFLGQKLEGTTGEIYGIAFNIHVACDINSSISVSGTPYKQRRLINYLMLNCDNVLMDCLTLIILMYILLSIIICTMLFIDIFIKKTYTKF